MRKRLLSYILILFLLFVMPQGMARAEENCTCNVIYYYQVGKTKEYEKKWVTTLYGNLGETVNIPYENMQEEGYTLSKKTNSLTVTLTEEKQERNIYFCKDSFAFILKSADGIIEQRACVPDEALLTWFSKAEKDGYTVSFVGDDGIEYSKEGNRHMPEYDLTITATYAKKETVSKPHIEEPKKSEVLPNIEEKRKIKYLTTKKIPYIKGYADGTVRPNANIARAEVAQVMYNLLEDKSISTKNTYYADVSADKWYSKAVNTISELNIMQGYEDKSFKPNKNITRAEFVTVCVNLLNNKEYSTNAYTFSDIKKDSWYYPYIQIAKENGFIDGYKDNTFKPDKCITRAEAVKIINKLLDRVPNKNYSVNNSPFIDLKENSKWYFRDILEASV